MPWMAGPEGEYDFRFQHGPTGRLTRKGGGVRCTCLLIQHACLLFEPHSSMFRTTVGEEACEVIVGARRCHSLCPPSGRAARTNDWRMLKRVDLVAERTTSAARSAHRTHRRAEGL